MIDPALLAILCCPETRQDLAEAEAGQIAALNGAIAAGAIRNRAGASVVLPLDGLLVRADGRAGYPVRNGIPVLIAEEAIPLP